MSRELIVGISMSTDGFVGGPNGEMDWVMRHRAEDSAAWLAEKLGGVGLHAMGRRAFEQMASFWPTAPGPFAEPMNRIPKAVFSRSGGVTLPKPESTLGHEAAWEGWMNPRILGSDLVAEVQSLKAEDGGPISVLGGATFASSLIAAGLADEIRLSVHPVALGRGLPLFADLKEPLYLKLVDLKQFDSGVVVKTYRPL